MAEARLMDYVEAHKLLESYGISTVKSAYVKTAGEAARFSAGNPMVLKAISGKALHKSKSGLVALNVSGKADIARKFSELSRKARKFSPYKILAQQMIPFSEDNVEIIVGGNEDSQFGKLVLLGLGGIYVEAFRDFSLRICPITRHDAEEMVDELKSRSIIAKTERRRKIVVDTLLNASRMLTERKAIKELDINPLILHGDECHAVDIRILG